MLFRACEVMLSFWRLFKVDCRFFHPTPTIFHESIKFRSKNREKVSCSIEREFYVKNEQNNSSNMDKGGMKANISTGKYKKWQ